MQIKLADMLEGLDETLPSVMRDIEKLPGWGICHEVYLRVDQAFQHHDDDDAVGAGEGIGVSLPPVQFPPFISVGKHFWAERYKNASLPLLDSLLHCFPPASIRGGVRPFTLPLSC